MRRIVIAFVLAAGFGGFILLGGVIVLIGGSGQGGSSWGSCSANLGPWGDGAGRGQQDVRGLGPESRGLVQKIIQVGQQRQLPPRAWQVAIQAGKTESGMRNLTYGDRDSLGIFQMRPSMGWGSVAQLSNVDYQINEFYDRLEQVSGWQQMRPGQAAQRVEKSAFPTRYHQWEAMAATLVSDTGAVTGISGCEDMPSNTVLANRAIQFADDQIGKPYVWGAAGPGTFDCSGLTMKAWESAGVTIPKYSQDQYVNGGKKIPVNQAQPGDLVFWGSGHDPRAIHHVAIYLGNNEVLHAPQPGENVERTKMWDGGELIPMAVRPGADDPTSGTQAAGAAGPGGTPE